MRNSECGPVKFAPHCTGQGLRNLEMLKAERSKLKVRTNDTEGVYGIGKYRVNRLNIKGMESIEKTKLARIN